MFIMHNVQYTGQIFSGDWNEFSKKKLGGSVLYHLRIVHMKFHLKHISLSTSCIKGSTFTRSRSEITAGVKLTQA